MALPTFVAAGTAAEGIADVTPGLPAGWAADDIHLLCVESANQAAAAPAGWVETASSPQFGGTAGGASGARLTIFWRRAVAGDTAPTVTDTGDHTYAVIVGFRGCITTGNPWDVSSGGTELLGDTSVSIPGATTTVVDCLVVAACAENADSAGAHFSAWANADLATVTERFDGGTASGNGGGIGVATGEKATAGAYGATTATLSAGANQAFITLALKPPAGTNTPITLAVTSAFTPTLTMTRGYQVALPASSAFTATIVKNVGKALAVASAFQPVLTRGITKTLSVVSTFTAAVGVKFEAARTLAVTSAFAAALTKVFSAAGGVIVRMRRRWPR